MWVACILDLISLFEIVFDFFIFPDIDKDHFYLLWNLNCIPPVSSYLSKRWRGGVGRKRNILPSMYYTPNTTTATAAISTTITTKQRILKELFGLILFILAFPTGLFCIPCSSWFPLFTHSSSYPFIHSFNKCLLRPYSILDRMLEDGDRVWTKYTKSLQSWSLYSDNE